MGVRTKGAGFVCTLSFYCCGRPLRFAPPIPTSLPWRRCAMESHSSLLTRQQRSADLCVPALQDRLAWGGGKKWGKLKTHRVHLAANEPVTWPRTYWNSVHGAFAVHRVHPSCVNSLLFLKRQQMPLALKTCTHLHISSLEHLYLQTLLLVISVTPGRTMYGSSALPQKNHNCFFQILIEVFGSFLPSILWAECELA